MGKACGKGRAAGVGCGRLKCRALCGVSVLWDRADERRGEQMLMLCCGVWYDRASGNEPMLAPHPPPRAGRLAEYHRNNLRLTSMTLILIWL